MLANEAKVGIFTYPLRLYEWDCVETIVIVT